MATTACKKEYSATSPEKGVPTDHLLRPIRKLVAEILREMSPRFAKLSSGVGRPIDRARAIVSIAVVQIFSSIRSERMLIEQLQLSLRFRRFVGMEMDETVCNRAVISKKRQRGGLCFAKVNPALVNRGRSV